jgi:hypothetical protein
MRWLVVMCALLVGGVTGYVIGGNGTSEPAAPWGDGPAEVSNAFWDRVAVGDGGSSVEPESSCKEIGIQQYRCYARWAPTGQDKVFTYEGTVNVYPDGKIVVSEFGREPESLK